MSDKKRTRAEMLEMAVARSADYDPQGKLGNDPDFMQVKKSDIRTIRIDDEFLLAIKAAAKEEGFTSYQAYIKNVLRKHIQSRKREA